MTNSSDVIIPKLLQLLSRNNPDHKFIFQTFDDSGNQPGLVHQIYDTYTNALPILEELNRNGAGIFVTINESRSSKRTIDSIQYARAVWIDHDNKYPKESIPEVPATLTVSTSPGKYHRYWIFKDRIPVDAGNASQLKQWNYIQESLCNLYGSDPGSKDLARVLRVPGFYHMKDRENPYLVTERVQEEYPLYDFEYLLNELTEPVSDSPNDLEHSLVKAAQAIITGENFNNSLCTLSMHYARKQYPRVFMEQMLKGIMLLCPQEIKNTKRWLQRYQSIPTKVSTAIKKARLTVFEPKKNSEGKDVTSKYTKLEWPPGNMGLIARNVYETMYIKNKEIAIITALHIVGTFAGNRWRLNHVGPTYKRILLAKQGTGKDTTKKYLSSIIARMSMPTSGGIPSVLNAAQFALSGDFTSSKAIHQALIEQPNRSLIMSEAGHARKVSSGDPSGVMAYTLEVLSADYNQMIDHKQYSVRDIKDQLPCIYGPAVTMLHESVPDNYLELLRSDDALSSGEVARADIVYADSDFDVNEAIETAGEVSDDVIRVLSNIANFAINNIVVDSTKPLSTKDYVEPIYSREIEDRINEYKFNTLSNRKEFARTENALMDAILVRKYQKYLKTLLILSIADSQFQHHPRQQDANALEPIAEINDEHINWAMHYQTAVENTLLGLGHSGDLGDTSSPVSKKVEDAIIETIVAYKKCEQNGDMHGTSLSTSMQVFHNTRDEIKTEFIRQQCIPKRDVQLMIVNTSIFKNHCKEMYNKHKSPTQIFDNCLRDLVNAGEILIITTKDKDIKIKMGLDKFKGTYIQYRRSVL